MKSLYSFIKEALENTELSNLKVVYTTIPKDIIIKVPESYSEDDIMIWIDDTILEEMPSGQSYAKKLFGVNADNISDSYTEYDSLNECSDQTEPESLKWSKDYDNKVPDDVNLVKYSLKDFHFIITFDKFVLNNSNNVDNDLWKVFKNTQSSNINKYPLELKLDQNDISYDN